MEHVFKGQDFRHQLFYRTLLVDFATLKARCSAFQCRLQ